MPPAAAIIGSAALAAGSFAATATVGLFGGALSIFASSLLIGGVSAGIGFRGNAIAPRPDDTS